MTPTAKRALREHIMQSMSEGCIESWIEVAAIRRRMHTLPFDRGLAHKGRLDYYDHMKKLLHEHRVNVMMTRAVREAWQDDDASRRQGSAAAAPIPDAEGATVC